MVRTLSPAAPSLLGPDPRQFRWGDRCYPADAFQQEAVFLPSGCGRSSAARSPMWTACLDLHPVSLAGMPTTAASSRIACCRLLGRARPDVRSVASLVVAGRSTYSALRRFQTRR